MQVNSRHKHNIQIIWKCGTVKILGMTVTDQ
jgi:hypothetical protein